MVRRAERDARGTAARWRETRGRVDLRDLERRVGGRARAGSSGAGGRASSCRRPGGPTKRRWCAPGRGDRERVARAARARDVGEVERLVVRGASSVRRRVRRIGPRQLALQAQVQLAERARDAHLDAGTSAASCAFASGTTTRVDAGARRARRRARARRAPAAPGRRARARRARRGRRARPRASRSSAPASAIATASSRPAPVLRTSAGARLTVTRLHRPRRAPTTAARRARAHATRARRRRAGRRPCSRAGRARRAPRR